LKVFRKTSRIYCYYAKEESCDKIIKFAEISVEEFLKLLRNRTREQHLTAYRQENMRKMRLV